MISDLILDKMNSEPQKESCCRLGLKGRASFAQFAPLLPQKVNKTVEKLGTAALNHQELCSHTQVLICSRDFAVDALGVSVIHSYHLKNKTATISK